MIGTALTSGNAENVSAARRPGRPRSEESHRAILGVTAELMETMSVRAITIGGIAKAAGVGKPTIYRWWDTKCALVMDAFLARMTPQDAPDEDGNTIDSLTDKLDRTIKQLRGRDGKIIAEIIGEGQSDAHVLDEFRQRFFTLLLDPARRLIQQGKDNGEIDKNLDTELALDMIFGPIYYRLLVGHRPLDDDFARALPKRVLGALKAS